MVIFFGMFGGGISCSFVVAMGILNRLRLAKIRAMIRSHSPDMTPKRTKEIRSGIRVISRIHTSYATLSSGTVEYLTSH